MKVWGKSISWRTVLDEVIDIRENGLQKTSSVDFGEETARSVEIVHGFLPA